MTLTLIRTAISQAVWSALLPGVPVKLVLIPQGPGKKQPCPCTLFPHLSQKEFLSSSFASIVFDIATSFGGHLPLGLVLKLSVTRPHPGF